MALIPGNAEQMIMIGDTVEIRSSAEQPSLTYKIDFDNGRIHGNMDGIDAVRQAIYMILHTKRFAHTIYSWDYGIEIDRVIGKSEAVLQSELKSVISEALTSDARITDVTDFRIRILDKCTAAVEFTAVSIFGAVPISEEVTI